MYIRLAIAWMALAGFSASVADADVVADWNVKTGEILFAAKANPAIAYRAFALTQTAVYEAANRITGKYPQGGGQEERVANASVDAAIAAANRAILMSLYPDQQPTIDAAYRETLARVADGEPKKAGIAVGERAAAVVLERRSNDGAGAAENYRPVTTPGRYVPTALPAAQQWPQRKPWMLESPSQFRPGPPPALNSEVWARDYNEVKALGAKSNSKRTSDQTDVARFWEANMPAIYYGAVRSVAEQPGRDVTRNARLYAAVAQAMDDALIAVYDAKYRYNFWRPVTAIRNGDQDGNDATERDASWTPFIDTPMHPEYPCAHCILAATVGTVLQAEMGKEEFPVLFTSSYMVEGSKRSWKTPDEFIREVGEARICDGVHYRNSTQVGAAMGRQVGELAARKHFGAP